MLRIERLPKITFLDADSERTLDLSHSAQQIQAASEIVARLAPQGAAVGLIFRTSPELVIAWLGVLASGRVPLILQYPTEKISKAYWLESVCDTASKSSVAALLCSHELSVHAPQQFARCEFIHHFETHSGNRDAVAFPAVGNILQLSSGTTGFKKPVLFSFDAISQHAAQYNKVMQLGEGDCVVSWLPLYHDMGFIACFVMPLLLGIPVVFIDPIVWVHRPKLLYDAIDRHGGTVCYMPNFGFEVMAKLGKAAPLHTVRHWISCSETTYLATLEHFAIATGADPSTISTCYGMAENIFAVTQSFGIRVFDRNGQKYLSCGRPIPGTEVKEVSGELFVRSSYSLESYLGGEDLRDEQGFYPTGDLGFIQDGEVTVIGRKQDLANIAGRKFLLNDLDFILGRIFSGSAGRIASMSVFDPLIGTEKVLFLIESDDFWQWEHSPEPARLAREATGVEWLEVHFVPPMFITKTSSGKINRRKTLDHWRACQSNPVLCSRIGNLDDTLSELVRQFPGISTNQPVSEELDSLGRLAAKLFCEERGIAYAANLTLEQIASGHSSPVASQESEVFLHRSPGRWVTLGTRRLEAVHHG